MAELITVPLWDPVIAGLPFYEVLIFGLGMLLVFGLMAFKLEIYDRMEPVWGFQASSRTNDPLAIVIGMSGKIKMLSINSVAGIFSAMGLPLKWVQTAPTLGQMGKVNTIIVSDDWNIVHDVNIDYAIVEAVHKWNEKWKSEKHKNEDGTDDDTGYIFDSDSFDYHLMNGDLDALFPHGIRLPPLRVVNLHEIRKYLPQWTASHFSGYINAELDKRKPEDMGDPNGYIKIAIIAGGIMLICAALGYVILTAAK